MERTSLKKYWILEKTQDSFLNIKMKIIETGLTNKNTKELMQDRDKEKFKVVFK